MTVHHYYHIYADGDWKPALSEHLSAMKEGFPSQPLTDASVVGSPPSVMETYGSLPLDWDVYLFDDGWEQRTLRLIYEDVQNGLIEPDDQVLYAHTKGAANPSAINTAWRGCMTRHLVSGADKALALLAEGADTVGCHWLTPEEYPESVLTPYYGGNFWWATGAHLARLDAPSNDTRYHAETWLGSVVPHNPVSLATGWPGLACAHH